MKSLTVFAAGLGLATASARAENIAVAIDLAAKSRIAAGPFAPTWESLKAYRCPDWFRDAKFGAWAHWGPQSVGEAGGGYARRLYVEGTPAAESHRRRFGHPSEFGYKDIVPLWKAEKFDPDYLMRRYRAAGAKYFVTIGVHHDNFDLWNSKYHRWNAVNIGPHKDIVALWAAAARQQGLRFGVSEHLERSYSWFNVNKGADQQGPKAGVPYDGNDPKYWDFYHPPHDDTNSFYPMHPPEWWKKAWYVRIKDLIDTFQPDLLYSDSGMPFDEVGRRLVAHFYNQNRAQHQGNLEAVYLMKDFRDRTEPHGDFIEGAAVETIERGGKEAIKADPWQTDTTVGAAGEWFYTAHPHNKTATEIVHTLIDIVSKNGNLLLNFPQRPDGSLDAAVEKIIDELAAWTPVNGEGIYGTRPWKVFGEGPTEGLSGRFTESKIKYTAQDIRFTRKGNVLYAFLLGWPGDGAAVTIKALAAGPEGPRIERIGMLGVAGPLELNAALSPALLHGASSGSAVQQSTRGLHSPADAGLAGRRPNSTWETPQQAAGNMLAFKQDASGLRVPLPGKKPFDHAVAVKIELRDSL